jgi:hypothetical protein
MKFMGSPDNTLFFAIPNYASLRVVKLKMEKSNWLPQKQNPIQQNGLMLSLKVIKTFNNTGKT